MIDADVLFTVAALTCPGGVSGGRVVVVVDGVVDDVFVDDVFVGRDVPDAVAVVVAEAGLVALAVELGVFPRAAQAETVIATTVAAARTANRVARNRGR